MEPVLGGGPELTGSSGQVGRVLQQEKSANESRIVVGLGREGGST